MFCVVANIACVAEGDTSPVQLQMCIDVSIVSIVLKILLACQIFAANTLRQCTLTVQALLQTLRDYFLTKVFFPPTKSQHSFFRPIQVWETTASQIIWRCLLVSDFILKREGSKSQPQERNFTSSETGEAFWANVLPTTSPQKSAMLYQVWMWFSC